MAKVEYAYPIHELHGKVDKKCHVSFRGGHTYTLRHPRRKEDFSAHEKAYRKVFGNLNHEASEINRDESRKGEYQDWKEKGYTSRYRYILASLIKDATVP